MQLTQVFPMYVVVSTESACIFTRSHLVTTLSNYLHICNMLLCNSKLFSKLTDLIDSRLEWVT